MESADSSPGRYNRFTASFLPVEVESTLPLYAYRCTQCGHKFEKIQNFSAEPEVVCPKCGGALERPLTAPALQFKGAGWYVNDYSSKSSSDSSDSKSSDASTPAPADSKAAESKPSTTDAASKPVVTESASSKPATTTP